MFALVAKLASTPGARQPPPGDDDDLEDLPPIDGEPTDAPESLTDLDSVDDSDTDDGASGLDDSTGEDDALDAADLEDLEGDETERGWLDESLDSPELGELDLRDPLHVGLVGLVNEESVSLEDGEDDPGPDEDFGIGEGGADRTTLDSAEEGPLDADEELRDSDLPALDADEEPSGGLNDAVAADDAMLDEKLDEKLAGDEPLGVPWAAEPWARVGPPLGLAWVGLTRGISALACGARGALLGGQTETGEHQIVRVDLEGTRRVLGAAGLDGAAIAALAADGSTLSVVSKAGRLFVSHDGGERFDPVAVPEGVAVADVALASGTLWIRTRTGSLLAARDGGRRAPERCAVPGAVVALCRDEQRTREHASGAGIVALAVDDRGDTATLVRGGVDGRVACEAVHASSARTVEILAARGGHVAYLATSSKSGVVVRGSDGPWRRFESQGRVTGLTWLESSGTLAVATYSEADDTTEILRLEAGGRVSVVAKLGAVRDDVDSDGLTVAMAYDDPLGVVWAAGGFGVAAFAVE